MPVSSSTEHWIKPDALTINLNHFGDPDYLQVSVLAGAVVMAFKQDVIGYNAAHNYRTWPLNAANTYLETTSAYNVYARLTRSEVNARALVVYDTVLRDIEGREITYAEDGSEVLGEANPEYFFVFLGQISASVNSGGGSVLREWTKVLTTGNLDTNQQRNDTTGLLDLMFRPHYDNPLDPTEITWIEALTHLGVAGGITMYVNGGKLDIPSIYAGLPIDGKTIYWDNGVLKALGGDGVAESVAWGNVTGKPLWITDAKPIYTYSEIQGTPDLTKYALKTDIPSLSGYATEQWVIGQNYVNSTSFANELKKYVSIDNDESINGLKNFKKGLQIDGLGISKSQEDVIYLDANLVVRGGITMYALDDVTIDSIINNLPIASTSSTGVASFDSAYFTVNNLGKVSLIPDSAGLNEERLESYLETNKYATQDWVESNNYLRSITSSMVISALGYTPYNSANFTKTNIKSTLGISDWALATNKPSYNTSEITEETNLYFTDGRAVAALKNVTDALSTDISTKWTQDNVKISNWDAAYSWGNHASVGYALKSYVDTEFAKYVTLATAQTISGEKNFTGGLKVNGSPIYYDATNKYWKLEGDLLVTGGVTMYGSDSSFIPSTIMDAILYDDETLGINSNGELYVKGGTGGGLDIAALQNYLTSNSYLDVTGGDNRYLKLSGGTLTGSTADIFTIKRTSGVSVISFATSNGTVGRIGYDDGGIPYAMASGSYQEIIHAGNYKSYALPITGGSIKSSDIGLYIKRTSGHPKIAFYLDEILKGYIGYNADGNPIIHNASGNEQTIYHSGNFNPSNYLPLSGGTISKAGRDLLLVKNANASDSSTIWVGGNFYDYNIGGIIDYASSNNSFAFVNFKAYRNNNNGISALRITSNNKVQVGNANFTDGYVYDIWHSGNLTPSNYLLASSYTAADVLAKLKTVDGNDSGLDADLLDGEQESTFAKWKTGIASSGEYRHIGYAYGDHGWRTSGAAIAFGTSGYYMQLQGGGNEAKNVYLYVRYIYNGIYSDWKNIAFTDSNVASANKVNNALSWSGYSSGSYDGSSVKSISIPSNTNQLTNGAGFITSSASITGNAGSATKFQTARTIWGQSFDGTGNVSGNLSGVDGIRFSSEGSILNSNGKQAIDIYNDYLNVGYGYGVSGKDTYVGGNNLTLRYGTSQKAGIHLNTSGNVGIGTTSPAEKLDVNGVVKCSAVYTTRITDLTDTWSDGTNNRPWYGYDRKHNTGVNSTTISDYFGMTLRTANAKLVLTRDGNVGIGTTNPSAKLHVMGNILTSGGITMYSDQRKKTIIRDVELSLKQIADAPLIEHYYNSDDAKTTHVGSIAQYWAELNDWFCKLDNEGYYTMEIQNAALASAISIARELDRYETKTDKKIKQLKKRICQLEDELERLKSA